jgi:hypothetical protein
MDSNQKKGESKNKTKLQESSPGSRHLEASRFKSHELRLRPHQAAGEAMAAAQPKTGKRLGGMAEALAIAADLGFPAPPPQVHYRPLAPRLTAISIYSRHRKSPAVFAALSALTLDPTWRFNPASL